MSSWLQVTRKNCHNKSDDNINLETKNNYVASVTFFKLEEV